MKLELIASKVLNIKEIINLRLSEIDAGPLGNNPLSDAITAVMLSQMIRESARKIVAHDIRQQLFSIGKEMMLAAMDGLAQGYDEGDDICPLYFRPKWWHFFGPQPEPWGNERFNEVALNPQPLPPAVFTDFGVYSREIFLAETLRIVASLTTNKYFNEQIKLVGLQLMKGAASEKAYEEFEFKCGSTGPRSPFPKRRVLVEQ